jgi:hypothetical protein
MIPGIVPEASGRSPFIGVHCMLPPTNRFGDDPNLGVDSWRLLLGAGATTVYPAHGKPFPVEVIRRQLAG